MQRLQRMKTRESILPVVDEDTDNDDYDLAALLSKENRDKLGSSPKDNDFTEEIINEDSMGPSWVEVIKNGSGKTAVVMQTVTDDKNDIDIDSPAIVSDSESDEDEPKEPQIKQDEEKKKKVTFEDARQNTQLEF